jgi:hypothetical protein
MIVNGNLTFHTAGSGELQNAVMENLTTVARDAIGTPGTGRIIFNTTTLVYNFYDGSTWQVFGTGGAVGGLQTEVDLIETASGGIFGTTGAFSGTGLDAFGNVTGSTSLLDALSQMDTAITNAVGDHNLDGLTDVTITSLATNNLLQYNGTAWVNILPATIGGNAYETFVTDVGTSVVADQVSDTATIIGSANGGLQTTASGDTISLDWVMGDLATEAGTIDAADFTTWADSTATATTVGSKVTWTQVLQDLDIVTAAADGILVRTAADTFASRTLTLATTGLEGLSLTNANGVAGDPTLGFNLTGLTAEVGTLSASDEFAIFDGNNNVKVTLTQLSAGINAAAPLAIDDLSDVVITSADANDFIRYDGSNWVDTDVAGVLTALNVYTQTESDNNFLDVAGDTMTGPLNMGSQLITSVAAPTTGTDAANKAYVDATTAGLTWKNSTIVATTTNINLATGTLLTVDGVTVAAGDRVLVKEQTDAAENGIYIAAVGAWSRSTDMDSLSPIDEVNSAAVFVEQGTANADTGWTVSSTVAALETDDVVWTQFTGASGITAGAGLLLTGNTLDVNYGAGLVELPTDGIGIDLFADEALHLTTTGSDDSTVSGSKLQLRMDGSTLTSAHAGLKVTAAGITETELNASVAGDGLEGGAGTALSLDLKAASGVVIDTGELSLSAIPNAALANAALTIAADSGSSETADLGETVTIAGGTGIDTVVSATNTVTATLNAGIDLLTDVDTTTAAPSNDDTLIWDGSNWVPGNPINTSAELTDVTAAATVAGQVLVSDGTNYTPRQIQYVDDVSAAATTWTVNHSLNQKFVNVTVYDSADSVIIPQSIVATDANTTTITFNTAISGTAVVVGAYGLAAV